MASYQANHQKSYRSTTRKDKASLSDQKTNGQQSLAPSKPVQHQTSQFEVRRTQSFSSFGREQNLPKLPADDFSANRNPQAQKILQNMVDILTTWNDSDWRQLSYFDEQLKAVFDTFQFRCVFVSVLRCCTLELLNSLLPFV
jgi:hypothetical protein